MPLNDLEKRMRERYTRIVPLCDSEDYKDRVMVALMIDDSVQFADHCSSAVGPVLQEQLARALAKIVEAEVER